MLRCQLQSLTIFLVLFAFISRQQIVRAAPGCDGDCLEDKLDEILSKLKTLNGKVESLAAHPEIEPPAACAHHPHAHRKQHVTESHEDVESRHQRRHHARNFHSGLATSSLGSSNHKCAERLAQICNNVGVSEIQLDDDKVPPFKVLCGAERWIVILQRLDGSVAFHNRTWDAYKQGFGSVGEKTEFFLGLQHLHELTYSGFFEVRIDLEDFQGVQKFAHYSDFSVFNEHADYKMGILGVYHGTAGDSFMYHEGQQFSATDRDNDAKAQGSCSEEYNSAGWFKNCMEANLFGKYLNGETDKFKEGMYWETFHGPEYSLKTVKMSVRAKC
ncbi:microfibril-associated glycoprotein 4-like [Bactrocera neohumeralis]|uniref:microfibril-associated glycoprotein 4-like n=1 Tax=Bactrocera neohumeralis TaxID=98809 RepID=UPI0021655290|nr:microfibril-associated glycoprotein 4-like [Bactrocera neohumeralis]